MGGHLSVDCKGTLMPLEEAHLADLCQGHGDGVELVLAGAGDQGFF